MNIDQIEDWAAQTANGLLIMKGKIEQFFAVAAPFHDRTASELARYFVALRHVVDAIEAAAGAVNDPVVKLKTEIIPTAFDREKISTFTTSTGHRVTTSSSLKASIKPDKKAQAYEWLQQHGLGSLITPTVNASTLSATAQELLQEGRDLDPGLFNQFVQNNTSITKIKTK